jgi:hypothetical protein
VGAEALGEPELGDIGGEARLGGYEAGDRIVATRAAGGQRGGERQEREGDGAGKGAMSHAP